MELIDADIHTQCQECQYFGVELIEFDKGIHGYTQICINCQIKAILMIKPMNFGKKTLSVFLKGHLDEVYLNTDLKDKSFYYQEMTKFVEWVKPFLKD